MLSAHSRKVWLGRLATDLAPGVAADYLNFFILYSGTNLALYFAVLRFFDGPCALIAAAFVGLNTIFIGALSVTYTGPSVLYNVIGIWLAAEAQRAAGRPAYAGDHRHRSGARDVRARPRLCGRVCLCDSPLCRAPGAGVVFGAGPATRRDRVEGCGWNHHRRTILIGAINWGVFGGSFLFFALVSSKSWPT